MDLNTDKIRVLLSAVVLAVMTYLSVQGFDAAGLDTGKVLAKVGSEEITVGAFQKRFMNFSMLTPLDTPPVRQALLNNMAGEKILLQKARELGLDQRPEMLAYARSVHLDEVLDAYKDQVIDTVGKVSEAMLAQAFEKENERIRARHLHAPTLSAANALYARLMDGASFDELAAETFRDPHLAATGGDLGYFAWDDMDQMFSRAAQQLKPGEISKPVATRYGYSIIKLENRFRQPILTESQFAKKRRKLHWRERHRMRAQQLRIYGDGIINKLAPRFNPATVNALWNVIKAPENGSLSSVLLQPEGVSKLDQEWLVRFRDQEWKVADLREKARATSERQQQSVRTGEGLLSFINGLIIREQLLLEATELGFWESKTIKARAQARLDRKLVETLQQSIRDTVTVPEAAVHAEYEQNPKQYIFPRQINLREITVPTRRQAMQIKQRVQQGASFASLARQQSMRKWSARRGGEVGFSKKAEFGALGDSIFALQPGQLGGPWRSGSEYVLVQILAERPQEQKTYVQARSEIAASLKFYHENQRLAEQISAWQSDYPIDVRAGLLHKLPSPLKRQ